jgi:hypothetical protein
MKKLSLGKRKVNVIVCSKGKEWETETAKGHYYEVSILEPELNEQVILGTSNYELKTGEQMLMLEVHPGKGELKVKVRKEIKEEKKTA